MEPERDFAAWLDRHDAEALGRVFDATGGKLLLLATHLARSEALAQDLVQATFLASMARGASWDRQRPLWPWLAAILQNELRMQWRGGRRRREVDLDAASGEHASAADPPSVASSQEVLAKVLAAIDAMPLPYRQVLRLRLVHGLRPVEIARSLEVPVGTVRAQLHRGLEQLRGVLPAGVAGLLGALLVGDDALLALVRQRVLDTAASNAPVAAGGAGAGWLLKGWLAMQGKTIVAVGGAMALFLVLGLLYGEPAWLAGRTSAPEPAEPVRAELPLAVGDATTTHSQPDRRPAAAADDAAWRLIVTVKANDGALVPQADVTVWATAQGGVYWNRDASEFGRADVAAGATGVDGVFRTSLDELREGSQLAKRMTYLWVEASWPHGEPRYQIVQLPRTREPQQVTVTIDLRRREALITGRAVDGAGTAIARAQVGTSRGKGAGFGSEAQTRDDGTFFVGWDGAADNWPDQLVIMSPAHGTATVALPAWSAEQRAVDLGAIVLQPGPSVHGRAVLGDGSALAGIQLQVRAIDPSLGDDLPAIHHWLMNKGARKREALAMHDGRPVWDGAKTNTRADGSFRFASLRPDGVYLLSVWAVGEPADTIVRPGGDPIELRIDKQLLTIDVFDEHGAPLPGAQVRLAGYDPSGTGPSYQKWPGFPDTGLVCSNWLPSADPDGRRIFLAPFGFVFRLTVADDSVQPIAVRHDVLPGVYRATCRLDLRTETRFGKLHICAVDENGAPIHFGPILKGLDRELQVNGRRFIKPPEGWTWDLPAGQWHVEAVLGKEVTYLQDDGGYARGFQEHVVTVEHGRTTRLKLVAPPAGLVVFEVFANEGPIASWRTLRVEQAGRELAVIPRDPSDPRPGTREGARITRFVSKQALAPGRHSFLLRADGYQAATCEVDIVKDQLNAVRVEMFAR